MQEKRINNNYAPLADRMRPETLNDYVGQKHLLIKGSLLYEMITNDNLTSMISLVHQVLVRLHWLILSQRQPILILSVFQPSHLV